MNILKGKSAVEKYGEDGKNGIIEITTDTPDLIFYKMAIGRPMPPKE